MNNIFKKNIILLSTLLVIFFILLGGGVFLFKKMQDQNAQVYSIREQIEAVRLYEKIFKEEALRIEKIKKTLSEVEQYIVAQETVPRVLSTIEQEAKKNAIELEITSVQIETTKEKTPYLAIVMKGSGDLPRLLAFAQTLESSKTQTSIEKITLSQKISQDAPSLVGEKTPIIKKGEMWDLDLTLHVISYK